MPIFNFIRHPDWVIWKNWQFTTNISEQVQLFIHQTMRVITENNYRSLFFA